MKINLIEIIEAEGGDLGTYLHFKIDEEKFESYFDLSDWVYENDDKLFEDEFDITDAEALDKYKDEFTNLIIDYYKLNSDKNDLSSYPLFEELPKGFTYEIEDDMFNVIEFYDDDLLNKIAKKYPDFESVIEWEDDECYILAGAPTYINWYKRNNKDC